MENLQTKLVRPLSFRLDLLGLVIVAVLAICVFFWGWSVFLPATIVVAFGVLLEGVYLSRRYTECTCAMTPWGCIRFFEPLNYTGELVFMSVGSGPRLIFFDRKVRDWTVVLKKSGLWRVSPVEGMTSLFVSYGSGSLDKVLRTCITQGLLVFPDGKIDEESLGAFIRREALGAYTEKGESGVGKVIEDAGFTVVFGKKGRY